MATVLLLLFPEVTQSVCDKRAPTAGPGDNAGAHKARVSAWVRQITRFSLSPHWPPCDFSHLPILKLIEAETDEAGVFTDAGSVGSCDFRPAVGIVPIRATECTWRVVGTVGTVHNWTG